MYEERRAESTKIMDETSELLLFCFVSPVLFQSLVATLNIVNSVVLTRSLSVSQTRSA